MSASYKSFLTENKMKMYIEKYGDDLAEYTKEEFEEEFGHSMPEELINLLNK